MLAVASDDQLPFMAISAFAGVRHAEIQRLDWANVDKAACDGEVVADLTPTWIAAQCGHVEAVEALGRLGADVNRASEDGRTPLHIAAQKGHTEVIEALGRLGAELSRRSGKGRTPLGTAIKFKQAEAEAVLRGLGAE